MGSRDLREFSKDNATCITWEGRALCHQSKQENSCAELAPGLPAGSMVSTRQPCALAAEGASTILGCRSRGTARGQGK